MKDLRDIHFYVSPLWKRALRILAAEEDTTITQIIKKGLKTNTKFLNKLDELELQGDDNE